MLFRSEAHGHTVLTAASGTQAEGLLAQERALDLVISALYLGDSDGLRLCSQMRSKAQLRRLPVLLVLGQEEFRARTASRDQPEPDAARDGRPRMIAQFGPWVVARVKGRPSARAPSLPGLAGNLAPQPGSTRKMQ